MTNAVQESSQALRAQRPDAAGAMATVHLVDGDVGARILLGKLLRSHFYRVRAYASAEEFLALYEKGSPCCLVLDSNLPGMGGLELHHRLQEAGVCPTTLFVSGAADVRTCAAALRNGAVDFLMKPVDEKELLPALEKAMRQEGAHQRETHEKDMLESRLARLTPREREVLTQVMLGRLNKQIAADLGRTEKTVKVHRSRAMKKMEVRSVAQVVRMVEREAARAERQA
jgi:RNA polymerase sigma factor (sigma-70 family)